jgi:hypothetical protein
MFGNYGVTPNKNGTFTVFYNLFNPFRSLTKVVDDETALMLNAAYEAGQENTKAQLREFLRIDPRS